MERKRGSADGDPQEGSYSEKAEHTVLSSKGLAELGNRLEKEPHTDLEGPNLPG